LKLCLFNVENLFMLSNHNREGFKKPQEKIDWIGRTLREIDADIIMLCEVGGLQSLDLFNHKQLSNNYYTALLPGNSDRGIEMGYLIHKRFPYSHQLLSNKEKSIDFNYPHELKNQADEDKKLGLFPNELPPKSLKVHKFSRDIAELRLIKDQKVSKIIFLVHLKSKMDKDGIDFNGSLRRKAELMALVNTYTQRKEEFPNIPIIVAGDFNGMAQRNSCESEFRYLYEKSDLDDVLEVINEPSERRHTYFHFNRENVREASQLDYIMIPPKLHSHVSKADSGIYLFRDQHGVVVPYPQDSFQRYALPSDHYPLVLTLENL
jgi:endonuclease/exonuclease/phosphatase family metal-dependent hydrolase